MMMSYYRIVLLLLCLDMTAIERANRLMYVHEFEDWFVFITLGTMGQDSKILVANKGKKVFYDFFTPCHFTWNPPEFREAVENEIKNLMMKKEYGVWRTK